MPSPVHVATGPMLVCWTLQVPKAEHSSRKSPNWPWYSAQVMAQPLTHSALDSVQGTLFGQVGGCVALVAPDPPAPAPPAALAAVPPVPPASFPPPAPTPPVFAPLAPPPAAGFPVSSLEQAASPTPSAATADRAKQRNAVRLDEGADQVSMTASVASQARGIQRRSNMNRTLSDCEPSPRRSFGHDRRYRGKPTRSAPASAPARVLLR